MKLLTTLAITLAIALTTGCTPKDPCEELRGKCAGASQYDLNGQLVCMAVATRSVLGKGPLRVDECRLALDAFDGRQAGTGTTGTSRPTGSGSTKTSRPTGSRGRSTGR